MTYPYPYPIKSDPGIMEAKFNSLELDTEVEVITYNAMVSRVEVITYNGSGIKVA